MLQGGVEVGQVVLVVGLAVVADLVGVLGSQVLGVGRGLVVLEGLVVRVVVGLRRAHDVGVGGPADGLAVLVAGRLEAALEPTPADALVVQQVADVPAGHHQLVVLGVGAVVEARVGVVDDGADAVGVRGGDHVGVGGLLAGLRVDRVAAVGLAGDQVERARGGGAVGAAEEVVAHREALGVVPQGGDGVAVVVVHHQAGLGEHRRLAVLDVRVLDELVHLAAVEGELLVLVGVVLVAGDGLGRAEPLRVGAVRVAVEQVVGEAVDLRGAGLGGELHLVVGGVGRVRVGAEVVVEGDVLLEYHHQVLDRGGGLRGVGREGRGRACEGGERGRTGQGGSVAEPPGAGGYCVHVGTSNVRSCVSELGPRRVDPGGSWCGGGGMKLDKRGERYLHVHVNTR